MSTSYAMFPRASIVTACEEYLTERRRKISNLKEELIKKEMSGWFFPAKNREAAIARLKADRLGDYNLVYLSFGSGYKRVENLLALATCANSDIAVSSDDLAVIASFLS